MSLHVIRSFMRDKRIDAWLLCDFRGNNSALAQLLPDKRWTTPRAGVIHSAGPWSSFMRLHGVEFADEQIAPFCRRHGVKRLAVFGSILRDDFGPDSDVDVLVEFEPDRTPGLFGFAGMQLELAGLLGRRVDLRTPEDLSRYFRDEVLREAVVQYAA
jgi:predicted nucleotidyltransferase